MIVIIEIGILYLLLGFVIIEARMKKKGLTWKDIPQDYSIRMTQAKMEDELEFNCDWALGVAITIALLIWPFMLLRKCIK